MLMRFVGKKLSQFYGGKGAFFNLKTITVPSDYPTKAEADANTNVIYVGGGSPSVTDNDPTKTNTGFVLREKSEAVWDPKTSMYYEIGPQAIWVDDGTDVKMVIASRNLNLQDGGLKDTHVTTPIKLGDPSNTALNTTNKTLAGGINELKAQVYIATVGSPSSPAQYNSIKDAIDAGNYFLEVIDNFTETQDVTIGANSVFINIKQVCNMGTFKFNLTGAGNLTIESSKLTSAHTTATQLFSNTGTGTVHLADLVLDSSAATGAMSLYNGQNGNRVHVDNCRVYLSNNANAGFMNCFSASSISNCIFIGAGTSCENCFEMKDGIVSNTTYLGTFPVGGKLLTLSNSPSILNGVKYQAINRPIISIEHNGNQIDNINGNVIFDLNDTQYNLISNCYIPVVDLSDASASNNFFTNIYNINVNMTIAGYNNNFVNFRSGADIIVSGDDNSFLNSQADDLYVNGDNNGFFKCFFATYSDTGTGNEYITYVSPDGTLTANTDRYLSTQKAIKTYADNLLNGVVNISPTSGAADNAINIPLVAASENSWLRFRSGGSPRAYNGVWLSDFDSNSYWQTTNSLGDYIMTHTAGVSFSTLTTILRISATATYFPNAYGDTVAGGTALYMKSDGQIGTTTSLTEAKTNIKKLTVEDAKWLLKSIQYQYNYKKTNKKGEYVDEAEPWVEYGPMLSEVKDLNENLIGYKRKRGTIVKKKIKVVKTDPETNEVITQLVKDIDPGTNKPRQKYNSETHKKEDVYKKVPVYEIKEIDDEVFLLDAKTGKPLVEDDLSKPFVVKKEGMVPHLIVLVQDLYAQLDKLQSQIDALKKV